eukprot:NODE_63_length_25098_cov_0.440498.p5 type:complete len:438 gc:universal NODE_63_length_25098_cov_0.440498:2412-3725(+)
MFDPFQFLYLPIYLFNKTWFVPDEQFQSIGLAHRLVFGYGELVWEYTDAIRSGMWYGIFNIYFEILHYLDWDTVFMINDFPIVVVYLFMVLTHSIVIPKFGKYYWLVSFHWMHYFMSTRTLVNTIEYMLYSFAIHSRHFYFFVIVGCIIRPTMAVFFIPFFIRSISKSKREFYVWISYAAVGVFFSVLSDSIYYGRLTSSICNFITFNIVKGHSEYYGVHSPFWYFTSAIPTLLGPSLLYFIVGIAYSSKSKLFDIFIPLILFSLLKHKEFRFIYPLMDQLLLVSKHGAERIKNLHLSRLVIFVNCSLILFFGFVHQRGIYDSMNYLRTLEVQSLLILAPCYSFPGISYFHSNFKIKTLSCDPPHYLNGLSEQDVFYSNPQAESYNMISKYTPTHLLKFSSLNIEINGYHLDKSFFNSIFHDDNRRVGLVELWVKSK